MEDGRRWHRSPAYPAVSLGKAVDRARVLYDKEKQHPTRPEVVYKHWGFAGDTSSAQTTLAALRYFGLILSEGTGANRFVRISPRALSIILAPVESGEQQDAIRAAALSPRLYAELWEEFGPNLPSDENLRLTLIKDRGFNPDAVPILLKALRETIEFARLGDEGQPDTDWGTAGPSGGSTGVQTAPDPTQPPPLRPPAALPSERGGMTTNWTIPLMGERIATLNAPRALSPDDFELITGWLKLMRRALVQEPRASDATGDAGGDEGNAVDENE